MVTVFIEKWKTNYRKRRWRCVAYGLWWWCDDDNITFTNWNETVCFLTLKTLYGKFLFFFRKMIAPNPMRHTQMAHSINHLNSHRRRSCICRNIRHDRVNSHKYRLVVIGLSVDFFYLFHSTSLEFIVQARTHTNCDLFQVLFGLIYIQIHLTISRKQTQTPDW